MPLSSFIAIIALVLMTFPTVSDNIPAAQADVDDCTGTAADPIFPGYDSSEKLGSYDNPTAGEVFIRRGFYCVPKSSQGNPVLEAANGFGFGLDKVQNRHYIGRPQDGYDRATALRAVKFVLAAPSSNVTTKTDDWGFGWNFLAYANGGTECPKGSHDPEACANKISVPVRAASTEGGAEREPKGGMPAGDPLGLQTVYCDYGAAAKLRCDLWVTAALDKGAKGRGIK
ncbi:hypothetical protein ACFYO1_42180 [Nocardia sp. NPDC006044]|uniref:hypothetical protein n=1 Tax=Nocardia sp. NPDC006044 TaxID=3364306 RepID=UPI0036AD9B73